MISPLDSFNPGNYELIKTKNASTQITVFFLFGVCEDYSKDLFYIFLCQNATSICVYPVIEENTSIQVSPFLVDFFFEKIFIKIFLRL